MGTCEPLIRQRFFTYFLSLFAVLYVGTVQAQVGETVVGCGGFIRWRSSLVKAKIDYYKLKVNLYLEESDALKDVTDVLPNGAFSVPLYDQGLYRLRLSTPKGWHVEPADGYPLDLRTNPTACASDFNFEILGFSVTGQVVTYGLNTGPADLFVRLTSVQEDKAEVTTRTQPGGRFSAGPVLPGEYTLTVSDGEQVVPEDVRARQSVVVGSDNVVMDKPVVLLGHFVRGHVTDFTGQSLSNVTVYLLSNGSTTNIDCGGVSDATRKAIQLPTGLSGSLQLMCEIKTDATGQFSFNRLPGGDYALVPHYHLTGSDKSTPPVQFAFEPAFLPIAVAHIDVQLGPNTFRATGFQLRPGRVTWPNGQPISGAKITLGDAQKPVLSDQNGFYQVGFIQPQVYTIHVEADNAEFSDVTTLLSPDHQHLPQFQPTKLSVCGRLVAAADDLLQRASQFEAFIQIKNVKSGTTIRTEAQPQSGGFRFCVFLEPGRYELRPDVRLDHAREQPAYFAPASQTVELSAGRVSDIVFSQFTAKVSGRVTCLVSCLTAGQPLVIELSPTHKEAAVPAVQRSPLQIDPKQPKTGSFVLDNVYPGDYHIAVLSRENNTLLLVPVDGWCWSGSDRATDSSRLIHVGQTDLDWQREPALNFIQSGFAIRVQYDPPPGTVTSSPSDLVLSASGQTASKTQNESKAATVQLHWRLEERAAKICLPAAETVYEFSVHSPCVKLHRPSLAQIRPDRTCSPVLARSPLVRLMVAQLPLLIQLAHTHAYVPDDRAILTKTPIWVDVTQPADRGPETGKRQKVVAKWSSSKAIHEPPVAQALLWIDSQQSVRIEPRQAGPIPGRWFFTHLIPNGSVVLNPTGAVEVAEPLSSDAFQWTASIKETGRTAQPPENPAEFARCAAVYSPDLTARFTLELGVTLRGETHPAVKKAEVKLFPKIDQSSSGGSSASMTNQPLLPIHPTESIPTESTVPPENPGTVADNNNADSKPPSPIEIVITDVDGTFLFGPVPVPPQPSSDEARSELYRLPTDPTDYYTVELSKPGYEFTPQPRASSTVSLDAPNWRFKATKLSLVEVVVRHADDGAAFVPLQGVLVSIIGEGHRGNQFTDKSGLAHFVGLAPGQYYLRPMMKEYLFTVIKPQAEQAGQASPITVSEGVSVLVEVVAKRVAFSLSGVVTSLAQIPEPNVLVEAEWIPHPAPDLVLTQFPSSDNVTCQLNRDESVTVPREQAWTNADGQFQIRGLLPGCVYAVAVHTSNKYANPAARGSTTRTDPEVVRKSMVERAIPSVLHVLMAPYDASGLSFFAVRPFFMQTLTASVDTPDEFLSTLRLTLFPLDRPDLVVVKHDFSVDSMLFMLTGPKLASIAGQDHVLRLESELKSSFYTNIASQDVVVRLRPGKSEHLQFSFRPKLRSNSPESSSSKTEL